MTWISRLPRPIPEILRSVRRSATERAARVYRRALGPVTIVGVTGSCGKTTTTTLVAAILGVHEPVYKSATATNEPHRVAESILSLRRRHRFGVFELGGFAPGILRRSVGILRPRVGVVTRVGYDHYTSFRGLDATAKEKGTLVEMLPENGVAVLNADDERVLCMRARTGARVVTYGLADGAMVRGEDVRFSWSEGLTLTVAWNGERVALRSHLVGEHWAGAVLAALATGIALGVPLADGARAVAAVKPVEGRLSVREIGGVTFVEDTWKAPFYTIPASLRVLSVAEHRRRFAVIGSISDYPGAASPRYRDVARRALEVADEVIFVGPLAESARRAGSGPARDRIHAVADAYELRGLLRDSLGPGDLVLLKGSAGADHLERIVLDRIDPFPCWRIRCGRLTHCADCALRKSPYVPGGG